MVVESSGRIEPVDKLSIVGKIYVGMKGQLEPLEDETGLNAVTLYIEREPGT